MALERVKATGDGWDLPGGNSGTRSPRPEGKAGVIERGRIWVDGRLADYTREEPGFPVVR